jgi:hypothetical protein
MNYYKLSIFIILCTLHNGNSAFRSTTNIEFNALSDDSIEMSVSPEQVSVSTNLCLDGRLSHTPQYIHANGNIGQSSLTLIDTNSGNLTLELPTPSTSLGHLLKLKKTSTTNSANLNATYPSGNIDTFILSTGNEGYLELYCNGNTWIDLLGNGYQKSSYNNPLNAPVFWLPMNEGPGGTLADTVQGITPNNFDAGITWIQDRDGDSQEYALDFNGVNSFASMPYNTAMIPSANTSYSVWVNISSLNVTRTVFRLVDNGFPGNKAYEMAIVANDVTTGRFKFYAIDPSNDQRHYGTIELDEDLNYQTGQWLFLVVSTTASSIHFYAYSQSSVPTKQSEAFPGFNQTIGYGTTSASFPLAAPYSGKLHAMQLDDLRIYDFTLSETQIQSLYEAGPQ